MCIERICIETMSLVSYYICEWRNQSFVRQWKAIYVCHSPIKFYWNPALICFLSKYFSKNLSGIMLFFNVEFTIAVTIKFMSELLLLEGFGSESCMALNINRNLQDISMLILSYPDWIIWMFESFEVILWSVFNSKSSNTH